MTEYAQTRITDLKSRGYDKAGLYDPPGVSGTHVMYVLQHADQPDLYSGLPKDPKISGLVQTWKSSAAKYTGLAAVGIFAAAGLLHHLVTGANRVTPEDEAKAKTLVKGGKT